ncbi:MAG: signal peptidase II [Clostridia bacterium]|nr:signal peptidase II [Clostridia bacterium]
MVLTIVLAAAAVLVVIDQIIKYFIVQGLAPNGSMSVIDGLFSLTYVENRGVAFGMFQNHVWIFAVITSLLIGVFIWLIIKKKFTGKLFCISAALMIGGGIGNLIDRIFRGFVVDYLSLSFFPPVCNFADYCITIGAVLLVIVLLFKSSKESPAEEKNNNADSSENVSEAESDKDPEPKGETDGD